MTTTDIPDYAGPYQRVLPESRLEALALEKLIRSELPRRWQDHGVYTRPIDDEEGRVEINVSPSPGSPSSEENAAMSMDLTEYKGTAFLLKTPSGQLKVAWRLTVGEETQSNILPHEPALIS